MGKGERDGEIHKAHVLVLPGPAQGHINPMLEFSKRLAFKGIKVTFIMTRYLSKSIHMAPYNSIHVDTISDGYDEGGVDLVGSPEIYWSRFKEVGSRTLSELINRLNSGSDNKVSGLVFDAALPWAFSVAKEFGILAAAFFTQSCAVGSVYYHLQRGLISVPLSGPTVSLPGVPKLGLADVPSFVSRHESYPMFLNIMKDQFANIDQFDWVLVNIYSELEMETVEWMRKKWKTAMIGPTVPSAYLDKRLADDNGYDIHLFKPDIEACMSWLQDKPSGSVVYVSFGSIAAFGKEQMEELAWGLKESDCYFLWVVRASEEAKLPPDFASGEKGLVVNWCPQVDVLMHDSVGCFVTHCGFNSVLEAMSLGVPMVAMPQWTDQPTNAKFVEDVWKVGVRARADEIGIVRRETVKACVKEVIEGEKGKEIKKNAKKWGDLAKKAVDAGGSSDICIDEFVADLIILG